MIAISKRTASLFKVAVLPGAFVAAACDFLTPVGGALVAVLVGAGALALLIPFAIPHGERLTPLERLTDGDTHYAWWWEGQSWVGKHGVHAVALFGLMCLSLGAKSYTQRDQGGYLATHVPAVSEAQEQLNLLQQSLAVQREVSAKLDTVAQETSHDPAKELGKLGFPMSHEGLYQAIAVGRADAVNLFADAKIALPAPQLDHAYAVAGLAPQNLRNFSYVGMYGVVHAALQSASLPIAAAIARLGTAASPEQCLATEEGGIVATYIPDTAQRQAAYRVMCGGAVVDAALKGLLVARQRQREAMTSALPACIKHVQDGIPSDFDPGTWLQGSVAIQTDSHSIHNPDQIFAKLMNDHFLDSVTRDLSGKWDFKPGVSVRLVSQACRIALDPTPAGYVVAPDETFRHMQLVLAGP